jgi:hypothetical protein
MQPAKKIQFLPTINNPVLIIQHKKIKPILNGNVTTPDFSSSIPRGKIWNRKRRIIQICSHRVQNKNGERILTVDSRGPLPSVGRFPSPLGITKEIPHLAPTPLPHPFFLFESFGAHEVVAGCLPTINPLTTSAPH